MFLTQRNWSELFELPVKEIHSHGLQQERNVLGLCVTVLGRNGFWALVDPGSNSSPPHWATPALHLSPDLLTGGPVSQAIFPRGLGRHRRLQASFLISNPKRTALSIKIT